MENKIVYDFSQFAKEEEKKDVFVKIKDKEFKINYNAFVSLKLMEISRDKKLEDDEIARKIIVISLGEEAWEFIQNNNISEYGLRSILGIVLFIVLDIKSPEAFINEANEAKKKAEVNSSEWIYYLDDWAFIQSSFAFDYNIILNKQTLENMNPQTFINLCNSFSDKSPMGKIWWLENYNGDDLTNEQIHWKIDRELRKNKNKKITSLF